MAGGKPRLGAAFSIGGDQAEADPLLEAAFYSSSLFESVENHDDPRCFLVGRTGSGKSALLRRMEELSPEKVVKIAPEDLSMPYITDLDVVARMTELGVDLMPFWKTLWRHVLIVEIIRHRYKIDSPQQKATFLQTLRDRLARNNGKIQALAYLDEFQGTFWAETDVRVREITTSLTKKIEAEGKAAASLGAASLSAGGGGSLELSETDKHEIVRRFQRVVNDTQLARLSKMMEVLDEDVLGSPQDFTYVLIDDLDKDWVDSRLANDLILALMKTVHDLKRVRHLKVLVALRTNIFVHLDFGASSAQEEKFRSLILPISWSRQQLTAMLDERVRVASERQGAKATTAAEILPNANPRRGKPLDHLLDRTLLRPRDLIAYFRDCIALSEGKTQISWETIGKAESIYSGNRLLALRDEWKVNYPGIESVFRAFEDSPSRMSPQEIQDRLDNCILLMSDRDFKGSEWLAEIGSPVLSGDVNLDWGQRYGPLIRLLFDINFLGASWTGGHAPVFVSDDENALTSRARIEDIRYFYVARTYHEALKVQLQSVVTSSANI
ncbi:MAG TPA: hypothetical protein VGM84_04220 [Steroidobacteraceae bacterium]|jgi:energy-coupling factor transporter ATP-binding protein EcfA2